MPSSSNNNLLLKRSFWLEGPETQKAEIYKKRGGVNSIKLITREQSEKR